MRHLSRWMAPEASRELTVREYLTCMLLLIGFVVTLVASQTFRLIILGFAVVCAVGAVRLAQQLQSLAASRQGEDIGTFARALDRRDPRFDPWVVRATWNALKPYVSVRGASVAIRPSDSLEGIIRIDRYDVWELVLPTVAERAGRSLGQLRRSSVSPKLETVEDLVWLVAEQPRIDGCLTLRSS